MASSTIPLNPVNDILRLRELSIKVQQGPLAYLLTIKLVMAAASMLLAMASWNFHGDYKLHCGDEAEDLFCSRENALFLYPITMYQYPLRPGTGPIINKTYFEEIEEVDVPFYHLYPYLYFLTALAFFAPLLSHMFIASESGELTALSNVENKQIVVNKICKAIVGRRMTISRGQMFCIFVHLVGAAILPITFHLIFPFDTSLYIFEQLVYVFYNRKYQVFQRDWPITNEYEISPSQFYFPPEFNCRFEFIGPSGSKETRARMCQYLGQDFHKIGIYIIWVFYYIDLLFLIYSVTSHVLSHIFPRYRRGILEDILKTKCAKDKDLAHRFAKAFSYSKVLFVCSCRKILDQSEIRRVMNMALKEKKKKKKFQDTRLQNISSR